MPNPLKFSELRKIFGRSLKDVGTRAQMGQMRLAKELGELVPGSKIYVSGAMSGLPGKNIGAFKKAENYLTNKGFKVLNPADAEKSVPAMYPNWSTMSEKRQWGAYMRHDLNLVKEADAVLTMDRGSFGTLRSSTLSRGAKQEVSWAKQMNKPVLRASRVEPTYGVMERADPHAKPLTAIDKSIEYERMYGAGSPNYAPLDVKNVAAGAVANPWAAETIPLSERVSDRSARVGGRRAQDTTAKVQADLRAARGDDVWGNAGGRNPHEQDREVLRRQNLRRNAQIQTIYSYPPGRPSTNVNPIGGRISGMEEGGIAAKIRKFFGWNGPNQGIFSMGSTVAAILDQVRGISFGGGVIRSGVPGMKVSTAYRDVVHELVSRMKSAGPEAQKEMASIEAQKTIKTFRKESADLIRNIRKSEKAGFPEPIVIRADIGEAFASEGKVGQRAARGLRGLIVHERTHQLRLLSKEFVESVDETPFDLSKIKEMSFMRLLDARDKLKDIGYAATTFDEEIIAYGTEYNYLKQFSDTGDLSTHIGKGMGELAATIIPGRPMSNVNPVGGRIRGMMGKFRSKIDTGFKSPWRGIIGISKDITALYSARLGGVKFGGLMAPGNIKNSIRALKQFIPDTAHGKFMRHKLAQHAVELRAAKRAGFDNAILIPKGVPGRKGLRATIVHERVHQIRKLEGTFGNYYGRDLDVGKYGSQWIQDIGYHESKVREEAIAFGSEFIYAAKRSRVKVGAPELEAMLNPKTMSARDLYIAGDLMDYAKAQKASWDIRPFIKKKNPLTVIPGRPMSNVNPVGGRISGMMGKFRSKIETGFKSPWRGILAISKNIKRLYISARIVGKGNTGFLGISDIRSTIKKMSQFAPKISEGTFKSTRNELAKHARDLRISKQAGFNRAIVIEQNVQGRTNLREIIVHERTHQTRRLSGSFGGADDKINQLGQAGKEYLEGFGYRANQLSEEAIAFGNEFAHRGKQLSLTLDKSIVAEYQKGAAQDLIDYARAQNASWDIRPFIKKNLSKQIQRDTMHAMSNVNNAQTRNTVSGLSASLHQSRGIRKGPSGGNG